LIEAILVACAQTQTSRSLQLLRRSEEEDRADHRWFDALLDGKELRGTK
jgi:hypothetical protein